MNSTIFPAVAKEEDLVALITQISTISGNPVTVKKQIVATTDDIELSAMLDNLADAIRKGRGSIHAKPKALKNGRTPKLKMKKVMGGGKKMEPTRGPHVRSIKVNSTGEMISRFELNRRLLEHKIEPGEKLHSPKYGVIVVQEAESDSMPHTLINEAGEPL